MRYFHINWPLKDLVMSSDDEPIMSKPIFFGTALACISGGMLIGFTRVLREQKVTLSLKSHGGPTATAGKALFLGTLLCFGTFAAASSIFVATTGITTTAQFGKSSRNYFSQFKTPLSDEEKDVDAKIVGLDELEEVDFIMDRFFSQFDTDEKEASTATDEKKSE